MILLIIGIIGLSTGTSAGTFFLMFKYFIIPEIKKATNEKLMREFLIIFNEHREDFKRILDERKAC